MNLFKQHHEFIADKSWNSIATHDNLKNKARRGHCAFLIGNLFIVHGGFGNKGLLNDLNALNMETKTWSKVNNYIEVKIQTLRPAKSENQTPKFGKKKLNKIINKVLYYQMANRQIKPIAFHKGIPIFKDNPQMKDMYTFQKQQQLHKEKCKVQQEGVYFFGGLEQNGTINNEIRILKVGQYPCKWIKPKTKGKNPAGRYLHSMHYLKEQNILIVYGGKSKQNRVLNEIQGFDLIGFNWFEIKISGNIPDPSFNHSSVICKNKMYVFGGLNLNHKIHSKLRVLELGKFFDLLVFQILNIDQYQVHKILEQEKEQNKSNMRLSKIQSLKSLIIKKEKKRSPVKRQNSILLLREEQNKQRQRRYPEIKQEQPLKLKANLSYYNFVSKIPTTKLLKINSKQKQILKYYKTHDDINSSMSEISDDGYKKKLKKYKNEGLLKHFYEKIRLQKIERMSILMKKRLNVNNKS